MFNDNGCTLCITANLHSKDDLARLESADACKRLAQQCSDAAAIELLLDQVFAVFHGSEGKLTVAEQKISVLQVQFCYVLGLLATLYVCFSFILISHF